MDKLINSRNLLSSTNNIKCYKVFHVALVNYTERQKYIYTLHCTSFPHFNFFVKTFQVLVMLLSKQKDKQTTLEVKMAGKFKTFNKR